MMDIVIHTSTPSMVLLRRIHKRVHYPNEDQIMEPAGSSNEIQAAVPMPNWPCPDVKTWFTPEADLRELPESFQVFVELPGVPKEAVEVEVAQGVLTIKGMKAPYLDQSQPSRGRMTCEREFGQFSRTFSIPTYVDPAGITATMVDGVLKVLVPKPLGGQAFKIGVQ